MTEVPPAGPPGPGATPDTGVPTCFRHPGRETYVSCVRCGRPACPDCLRSAAVGQQCVECVRSGNRGTRPVSAVFGGRAISGAMVTWVLRHPLLTRLAIAVLGRAPGCAAPVIRSLNASSRTL